MMLLAARISRSSVAVAFQPISFVSHTNNHQKARGAYNVVLPRLHLTLPDINLKWRNFSTNHEGVVKGSPQDDDDEEIILTQPTFEKGDKIQVEVISFGRLGASVDVIAHNSHNPDDCIGADEPALGRGLILQREIAYFREKRDGVDVVQYETLPAYVENVRVQEFEEGKGVEVKLDISLRPIGGKAKALELSEEIMQKLNEKGGVLSIGDKSPPEDISEIFPGASKKAFKKAVSSLYKQGLVDPKPDMISLMKK
eukprot:scaffold61142_cov57-Cyclotella_meneghiniana.AAC.6